jgi:spermidine synthase
MSSGKVRLHSAEPVRALAASSGAFDVILVDLPDPSDYVEGKHYTSYFFRLLAGRLAHGGVGVVQATSISNTPRTFASIRSTLQASGLHTLAYAVPVPSLGDWGFILFSQQPLSAPRSVPNGLRFLTPAVLPGLFALPAELLELRAEPSTLHDQRTVTLFEQEQRAVFGPAQ